MKNFKFLNENTLPIYDGDWSVNAVRFVHDYIINYTDAERIIDNETYRLTDSSYRNGNMTRCTVVVTNQDRHIKIVFSINIGNAYPYITDHTIYYE